MKKIYIVATTWDGPTDDEWEQLITYSKEEAIECARKENQYNDKHHHTEARELEVKEDFDIEAYKEGERKEVDEICNAYANGYNSVN